MNGYSLSKSWFEFTRSNFGKVRPAHSALFFYIIEHCNSLGWAEQFGLPTIYTMHGIGISSIKVYLETLHDLERFGFIKIVEKSKNQHTSTVVALVKNTIASTTASTIADTIASTIADTTASTTASTIAIPPYINNKNNKTIKHKKLKNDSIDSDKSESANGKLHQDFISVFTLWYENKIGMPYRFSGGHDGKAVKEIIGYIKKAQREKNGRDPIDSEILNGWEFILNNYSKWDSFYQSQIKLSQINSNIPNIMANIKGISRKGNNLTTNEQANEISRLIAAMGN